MEVGIRLIVVGCTRSGYVWQRQKGEHVGCDGADTRAGNYIAGELLTSRAVGASRSRIINRGGAGRQISRTECCGWNGNERIGVCVVSKTQEVAEEEGTILDDRTTDCCAVVVVSVTRKYARIVEVVA